METNPLLNRQREMFDALRAGGLKAEGWDLLILYAQFILESGYGKNELSINAYNPFSIKAFKSWKGERYLMEKSPEWDDKVEKIIYIPVEYRKYPNFTEALKDYVDLIKRIYPESYAARSKYSTYYHGLYDFKYKYCPDPKYPENLSLCYEKWRLQNNGEFYLALMGQ